MTVERDPIHSWHADEDEGRDTGAVGEPMSADDTIRDLLRDHSKKELIELVVVQTQAAVDAEAGGAVGEPRTWIDTELDAIRQRSKTNDQNLTLALADRNTLLEHVTNLTMERRSGGAVGERPPDPDPKDEIITRLRRALEVAGHRPHDTDGPTDEDSGFPTCSGCGAILTGLPSAPPGLDVERLAQAIARAVPYRIAILDTHPVDRVHLRSAERIAAEYVRLSVNEGGAGVGEREKPLDEAEVWQRGYAAGLDRGRQSDNHPLDVSTLGRAIHRVFRHGVHGPGRDDGDGDLAAAILDEYARLSPPETRIVRAEAEDPR